jgi:aminoglycoside phosphotransferase
VTRAATEELVAELERSLGRPIARVRRRPSTYATSFALEELDVELADGEVLPMVLKDVARSSLSPAAHDAKPGFLYDPLREIEVYTRLLAGAGLGTAACHGTAVDHDSDRYWLFLERVEGVELYQAGPRATWEHVARWLARMHHRLATRASMSTRLLRYDAESLRRWPRRAAQFAAPEDRAAFERIASRYEAVAHRILALPAGLIHGEFYASNVLVDDPVTPSRVCPVDWEVAAVGPGLIDLAALVSGRWSADDRAAIAAAYYRALPAESRPPEREFADALDACRLHLALQWLGWSPNWTPPAEHATDWRADAFELASSLGL